MAQTLEVLDSEPMDDDGELSQADTLSIVSGRS
jgi:hypothetical protein